MIEVLKVADVASKQSDRWFFAVVTIILFVFAYSVIRYLVKENGAARTAYHDTLRQIITEQNQITVKLQVSLDRNTEALRINSQLLERANKNGG